MKEKISVAIACKVLVDKDVYEYMEQKGREHKRNLGANVMISQYLKQQAEQTDLVTLEKVKKMGAVK